MTDDKFWPCANRERPKSVVHIGRGGQVVARGHVPAGSRTHLMVELSSSRHGGALHLDSITSSTTMEATSFTPVGDAQPAAALYPNTPAAALKPLYVGKRIADLPAPAPIIDAAIVRRNCARMLNAAQTLAVKSRAHVKTHKTAEIAELQVGADAEDIRLVVSTVAEIEHLVPWLLTRRRLGHKVSVLYGQPLVPSAIPRLAAAARLLGPGSVGVCVDHSHHITSLDQVDNDTWPGQIPVFVLIDVGYHREGVAADSAQLLELAAALSKSRRCPTTGVYTHYGSSYSVSSPEEALQAMTKELRGLKAGADALLDRLGESDPSRKLVLSLGATPTATSIENLLDTKDPGASEYLTLIADTNRKYEVEYHAGVYALLDLMQLATHARASGLSHSDIALRMLVEVSSVYSCRDRPEALVAAGSIALGRDPVKDYEGWGVVTPWSADGSHAGSFFDPNGRKTGWVVKRISQEHGSLVWEGDLHQVRSLGVGEKLLLWPNHACMAGPSFGCYFVVDSEIGDGETVVDVWTRCRGW